MQRAPAIPVDIADSFSIYDCHIRRHTYSMDSYRVPDRPEQVYRPFNNIPNELLALILTWHYQTLENDRKRFMFPLTIPQLISRRWRDVSLSTPSLWTTVRTQKDMPHFSLEHYLGRSGSMNLNLDICVTRPPLALMAHAHRWSSVTIWTDKEFEADNILENISPIATSLRHFSLIFPLLPFQHRLSTRIQSLCPDLESLHLTHIFPNWGSSRLSFKNLVELVIRGKGIDEEEFIVEGLLDTLRASPRLRCLKLFKFIVIEEDIVSLVRKKTRFQPVELVKLEELVLADFYISEYLFLVTLIRCPNLKSLGVGLVEHDHSLSLIAPGAEWSAFSPLYPQLQRLDLWSLDADPDRLQLSLRNIRSVGYLAIRGCHRRLLGEHFETSFSLFNLSVHTLQTRCIDLRALQGLISDYFPNTQRIYMYSKDVDSASGDVVEITSPDGKKLEVILWGERDGDIWYLEGVQEREHRIARVIRESVLD